MKNIDKETLIDLYINQHLTRKEIAKLYDIKESTVKSYIQSYNIKKPKELYSSTIRRFTDLNYKDVSNYYHLHSLRETAKHFNKSVGYIVKFINHYGITKDDLLIKLQHKESIKKTNLEKYGVEYYTQSDDYKEKTKKTNLEKYGVEYYTQSDDYKDKVRNTSLQLYGVEHFGKSDVVIEKREKTNLERYNAKSPLLSPIICGNKVNYSQTLDFKEKYIQRCLDRYGVDNYSKYQIPQDIRKIIYNKSLFKEEIEKNGLEIVGEMVEYFGIGHTLILKLLTLYNMESYIKKNISSIEKEIRTYINQHFETQNNIKLLDGKEIDIFIPNKNIGIEFNGNYWHGEKNKGKTYHQEKSLLAEDKGIFLYHIFEYEWNTKRGQILNQLNNLLGLNQTKIYARKCVIKEVNNTEKRQFLELNHIQGCDVSSIKLGLYYDNELVSIMTFCKPRFNKKYQWELSRFCSKAGCNVIGGASKLFKHFIKTYDPKSIISYSNIAHTRGNLYKTLGMTLQGISEPNYVWSDGHTTLSRYQCQKHKLIEQDYQGKSEVDIMHNRGYYRIYDCGNKVWVWNSI